MQFIQFLNKFWHQKIINYSLWELQLLFESLCSFIIYKIVGIRMLGWFIKIIIIEIKKQIIIFYKVQLRGHEKNQIS